MLLLLHVCLCFCRVKPWITLTGVCAGVLWTAQSWGTCWRRASTQGAPPVWVTRTPMIQMSPQRKRSLQRARACLIPSLCVARAVGTEHTFKHTISKKSCLSCCSRLTRHHQRRPTTSIPCLRLMTLLLTHSPSVPPQRGREHSTMVGVFFM